MEAQSLASFDSEYSADSIEFCPTRGYERVFVCGTYQLLKPEEPEPSKAGEAGEGAGAGGGDGDAGKKDASNDEDDEKDDDSDAELEEQVTPPAPRVGRLYLFDLEGETPLERQRIETAAILDCKWTLNATTPELAVADAKGGLTLYAYESATLSQIQRLEVSDESTLVLSLDHSRTSSDIITSLSSGELAHIVRDTTGEMSVSSSWAAHDFEPWITAWDGVDPNTVWSGGDDLRLKRWDVRCPEMPTYVNRSFDGGVTTIAPSPHEPHMLAVGSYDARMRVFDTRSPRTPVSEVEMPGGIWRTRWHPSTKRKGDILNACMHGGFAVVRLAEDYSEGEITATFPGTLGYGADWSRREDDGEGSVVATCSFYDHIMHVWRA